MTVPAGTCHIELSCTDPNPGGPRMTIETTDPAPTPPEVLREQVARAMHETPPEHPGVYGRIKWERLPESGREAYRRMADAALAVFRGQQDPERREVPEDVAVTLLRGLTWCAAQISDEDREEAWAWVETGRANVEEMGS